MPVFDARLLMLPTAAIVSDTNEMDSGIFDAIARTRPEWIAQGVLRHVLIADKVFREKFSKRIRGAVFELAEPKHESICEEVPDETGWRTDLFIHWRDGDCSRIELKIGSALTFRQRQARERITAIITPPGAKKHNVETIDWLELSSWAQTGSIGRTLLEQVARFRDWRCDEISEAVVDSELESLASSNMQRSWRTMYRFLSTLDERLSAEVDNSIYIPGSWGLSKTPVNPWYGYYFSLGQPTKKAQDKWWLGFEKMSLSCSLHIYRGDNRIEAVSRSGKASWKIDSVVKQVEQTIQLPR